MLPLTVEADTSAFGEAGRTRLILAIHRADLHFADIGQRAVLHFARSIDRRKLGAARKVMRFEFAIHQVGIDFT